MTTPASQILTFGKGEMVLCAGTEYVITGTNDLDSVLARNLETGKVEILKVEHLRPPLTAEPEAKQRKDVDLNDVSPEDWAHARRCLDIIKPMLGARQRGNSLADQLAKEAGVSRSTIYSWYRAYRNTELLSSLLPTKPNGGKGKSRIQPEVETIIQHVIENHYETDQRWTILETSEEARRLCRNADLPLPSLLTVRKRIEWRKGRKQYAARLGKRAASLAFDAVEGSIPDAGWPLALVQIDHTKLPIMLVHDISRRNIGRPWVTFAIDVCSRMVPGMYLALEEPSANSAGMCISHAILPKEKWLAERKIEAEWPCWGVMGILHMDNAREFRGDMIKAACSEYDIDVHLRPVKKPEYGAHIERLMGTVSQKLKRVAGATFSSPTERGDYDSEAKASMTLHELEEWLTLLLAKYHHSLHDGIGTSPLQRYREGLLGSNGKPGRGLPARRIDEEKVRVDFMPIIERTVQDYGVALDEVNYFADVLRPWINARDPNNPKLARTFRFRRDPHDISQIYFFEPNAKRYFAIPYRNLSHPSITLWDLREAKQEARKAGIKNIDESVIFDYANRLRALEDQAVEKTKAARRKSQKRIESDKAKTRKKKELPSVTKTAAVPSAPPPKIDGYDPAQIKPLDED